MPPPIATRALPGAAAGSGEAEEGAVVAVFAELGEVGVVEGMDAILGVQLDRSGKRLRRLVQPVLDRVDGGRQIGEALVLLVLPAFAADLQGRREVTPVLLVDRLEKRVRLLGGGTLGAGRLRRPLARCRVTVRNCRARSFTSGWSLSRPPARSAPPPSSSPPLQGGEPLAEGFEGGIGPSDGLPGRFVAAGAAGAAIFGSVFAASWAWRPWPWLLFASVSSARSGSASPPTSGCRRRRLPSSPPLRRSARACSSACDTSRRPAPHSAGPAC